LEGLERLGVVERTVHSPMPPRTNYFRTGAGRDLQDVMGAIERWGGAHLKEPVEQKKRSGTRATA